MGRLSYTAPNFSRIAPNIMTISNILKHGKNAKITVVLDWLSVYFTAPDDAILIPENDADAFQFETNNLTLISEGSGNKNFRFRFKVFHKGEQLATLLSHTRNEKFMKRGRVKVDFANHLFYSNFLWSFYEIVKTELNLTFVNVSRFDIALDGANYLIEFFNAYLKQNDRHKVIQLLGRPRFGGNVYDRARGRFETFKFGKLKSGKEIIEKLWHSNTL